MGGGPEFPTAGAKEKVPKKRHEYKVIVTGMGVCILST